MQGCLADLVDILRSVSVFVRSSLGTGFPPISRCIIVTALRRDGIIREAGFERSWLGRSV